MESPNFNRVIASKYEFNRFVSQKEPTTSCESLSFALTSQQRIAAAFLSPYTPYNGLLIYHGTGTGKTCTAITIAEQFKNHFNKRHYVLCASSLKDNFKRQIFDETKANQCTGNAYKLDPSGLIKQNWEIRSFHEFAKTYKRLEEQSHAKKTSFDKLLKDLYSDRVFIIDEAHNVRLSSEAKEKEVPPKLEHVFRVAENVKLILLTATPMYNTASEIVFLMNLLLMNDKRKPLAATEVFDKNEQLTRTGKMRLMRASRGYVSINDANNPYTFPLRLYPDANKDTGLVTNADVPQRDLFGKVLKTYGNVQEFMLLKSLMTNHQNEVYNLFLKTQYQKLAEDEVSDGDETNASKMQLLVQVGNIAYPCNTTSAKMLKYAYGREGFLANFNEQTINGAAKVSYRPGVDEFLGPAHLGGHSAKIKSIVEYIKKSEGIVFVYSAYLYSGLVPLAIALEHEGYTKYGNRNLLATSTASKKKVVDGKPVAYVMITGSALFSPNNTKEIDVVRDKSNMHGQKVKVILASNVATEGIDFKYIREVHILEPWFHFNKLEQAFGRAIRHCSHADLPPEHRNVTLFQHVALTDDRRETIDMRMYNISITKQLAIDNVVEALKEVAVNAMLQERRFPAKDQNVRQETSQGNEVVYTIKGQSTPFKASHADKSTFRPEMARVDISMYKDFIRAIFQHPGAPCALAYNSVLSKVQEVQDRAGASSPHFDEDIFMIALHDLVEEQLPFVSRQKQGILAYKSDKYVFLPLDSKKMHMQACAQETVGNRLLRARFAPMIDDEASVSVNNQSLPTPKQTHVQSSSATSMPSSSSHKVQKSASKLLSISKFMDDITKQLKTYTELFIVSAQGVYKDAITDFVLDRLSCDTHMRLIETVKDAHIADRLFHLPQFLNGKYFVRFDQGGEEYYRFDNNQFEKCSVLETSKVASIAKDMISINDDAPMDAYIALEKQGFNFKMVSDDKKKVRYSKGYGSVCQKTSTIKVDHVQALVKDVSGEAKILSNKKISKALLCDIYEIILRQHRPDMLLRPYHVHRVRRASK
jgi:hypothetical protein